MLYKDRTPLYLLIKVNGYWYLKWDLIIIFFKFYKLKNTLNQSGE